MRDLLGLALSAAALGAVLHYGLRQLRALREERLRDEVAARMIRCFCRRVRWHTIRRKP